MSSATAYYRAITTKTRAARRARRAGLLHLAAAKRQEAQASGWHENMSVAEEERWLRDEQQTLWPTVPFDEFLTECAKSYSPYEGYNVPHFYVDAARRVMASRKEQA